jgi:hypothetical protein
MPDSDPAREVRFGIKTGAFYGQEAVFIEVRARSDPSPSGAAVRVKKRVNEYENRCTVPKRVLSRSTEQALWMSLELLKDFVQNGNF